MTPLSPPSASEETNLVRVCYFKMPTALQDIVKTPQPLPGASLWEYASPINSDQSLCIELNE